MTPGFYDLPLKVATSDGWHVKLLEPASFVDKAGNVHEIPAGTESDGGSEPREIWPEFPPFGPEWPAYVLHDHLYRNTNLPKAVCDSLLLEALEILGVSEIRRLTIYEGVHLGGWKAFNEDRAKQSSII